MAETRAIHTRWDDIQLEKMRGTIEKRFVHTDSVMLAQVYLKRGDFVPRHAHHNEQLTYVLTGALEFWLGDSDEQHIVVNAGEVLTIPRNLSHRAIALADSFELDIFNPPRQDWIEKTDDYLRK